MSFDVDLIGIVTYYCRHTNWEFIAMILNSVDVSDILWHNIDLLYEVFRAIGYNMLFLDKLLRDQPIGQRLFKCTCIIQAPNS